MTVEDADRIDALALSADGGTYVLKMNEPRLFEDSDEQYHQLMEKINAYAEFIQIGQLYDEFPDARGKALTVRLVCCNLPVGDRFAELLRAGAALFARHGADFSVEVVTT